MSWKYVQPAARKGLTRGVQTGLRAGLAALAAAGLLCQGGAFSPLLDLLNHLTPLYLLSALLLLGLELRRSPRSWALIGLAGVSILASGLIVGREAVAALRPAAASQGRPLTVLTQNVWQSNPDPQALARTIVAVDADVVVLEEAFGAGRPVVEAVAKAYPYRADCTVVTQWCALAIFSKRPIRAWSHHEGAWKPPEWDRLGLIRATIDDGQGGDFEVIGTQLLHPDTGGAAALQARQFLAAVDGVDPRRTILVGDFNRTAWAYSLRAIDERLPISRKTHGLATWPARMPAWGGRFQAPAPFLPIDQVYAGSNWQVVSLRRTPASSSDHFGVVATLNFHPR